MTASTWPPPDPARVALRLLEERTGIRAPYADPLTALRWLEQHTGTPPHVFGRL